MIDTVRAAATAAAATSSLVRSIVLIGSLARGESGPQSDTDLMIWLAWQGSGSRELREAKNALEAVLAQYDLVKPDVVWIDGPEESMRTTRRMRFFDVGHGSIVLYGD